MFDTVAVEVACTKPGVTVTVVPAEEDALPEEEPSSGISPSVLELPMVGNTATVEVAGADVTVAELVVTGVALVPREELIAVTVAPAAEFGGKVSELDVAELVLGFGIFIVTDEATEVGIDSLATVLVTIDDIVAVTGITSTCLVVTAASIVTTLAFVIVLIASVLTNICVDVTLIALIAVIVGIALFATLLVRVIGSSETMVAWAI